MVGLGFVSATILAARSAARFAVPQERIIKLSTVILISAIAGARACYVLLNIKDFLLNPLEIIMVNHGGLVFYGGAIAAFLSALIYTRASGLRVSDVADLVSPYIALGHSIGRIGCLLNGCCFGKQIGITRYPTQIISSLGLFVLYIFLSYRLGRRQFSGQVFFLYLIFYSIGRFLIEFLRGDNAPFLYNLTFSQAISLIVLGIGVGGYFLRRWNRIRS